MFEFFSDQRHELDVPRAAAQGRGRHGRGGAARTRGRVSLAPTIDAPRHTLYVHRYTRDGKTHLHFVWLDDGQAIGAADDAALEGDPQQFATALYGELIALDAKINFDDNAMFRCPRPVIGGTLPESCVLPRRRDRLRGRYVSLQHDRHLCIARGRGVGYAHQLGRGGEHH